MRKYYLAYALFLAPALIVSIFFSNASAVSISLRWFFAAFMLLGFGTVTYIAAYRYPRTTFSFILYYVGVNLIIINLFYQSNYGSGLYNFLRDYGGALSYVPLGILIDVMSRLNIRHEEVYITIAVTVCMLLGYLSALVKRRVKPDPYRPKIG